MSSNAPGSIFPRNGVPSGQAAPGADDSARATCDELFYKSSCNPRIDPQAMNSLISELLNVVNHDCDGTNSGVDWNCARQDNLRAAICRIVEDSFDDKIVDCIVNDFPDATGACEIETLVLTTDSAGCSRIARYSEASSRLGCGSNNTVWPANQSFQIPPDPDNDTTYYDELELYADAQAGTIDEAMLDTQKLTEFQINVPCDGTEIFLDGNQSVVFDSGVPDSVAFIAVRVDGDFLVNDPRMAIRRFGEATNFVTLIPYNESASFTLGAGAHTIETYWVGANGRRIVQARISTNPGGITGSVCGKVAVG